MFIKSVIIGNKRLTLFLVHLVGFHIVVRELDFEYDRNLYGPSHNIHLHHQVNNIGGLIIIIPRQELKLLGSALL